MNIKNSFSKYIIASTSTLLLAGTVAVASASAQTSAAVDVSATARGGVAGANPSVMMMGSTSMKGMDMHRMASTSMKMMASTTKMSSTTRQQKLEQRQDAMISSASNRSNNEIAIRINSLNTLLTRVNGMTKISASEKTTITTEVQNLISELNVLETKIQADASSTPVGMRGDLSSTSPLRMDLKSITQDYRVYALVIPQMDILAAADRGQSIVASMSDLSTKLQARITAAQSAGHDVSSLQASLSDLNAKMSDAQTQTAAAISLTANLLPDNGDTTIAASNTAAISSARADIQTANADIKAATADARSIVKGIEAFGGGNVSGSASAAVSASTSTQ